MTIVVLLLNLLGKGRRVLHVIFRAHDAHHLGKSRCVDKIKGQVITCQLDHLNEQATCLWLQHVSSSNHGQHLQLQHCRRNLAGFSFPFPPSAQAFGKMELLPLFRVLVLKVVRDA